MERTKALVIRKRARVQQLAAQGLTKTEIAKRLLVSRPFIDKWLPRVDVTTDRRGWRKGRLRVHTREERERIVSLRRVLVAEETFFIGPQALQQAYASRFPGAAAPPLRWIARVLREEGLAQPHRRRRRKGGARARHYPAQTLRRLGTIVEELDFIGPRFLAGCPQPFYLASRYYTQPFRFGWLSRVAALSMVATQQLLVTDWQHYPRADVLTLDNAFTFTAAGRGRGFLSGLLIFLLNLHVIPVLLPPREPWSHGSVEGHNSLFARKLWQRQTFGSLDALDQAIARLNAQYLAYKRPQWDPATCLAPDFMPAPDLHRQLHPSSGQRVYFIRCVVEATSGPGIDVLKLHVPLDASYLSQFVLACVDVGQHRVDVFYEQEDGTSALIHSQPFGVRLSEK